MKYAVVKIGGSQFKVSEGEEVVIEKVAGKSGDKLKFSEILLFRNGNGVKIGQPYLPGAVVEAEILAQTKGKKIRVATYKAKSRYRRVVGHRKQLTKIRVDRIRAGSEGSAKKPKKSVVKTKKTPVKSKKK